MKLWIHLLASVCVAMIVYADDSGSSFIYIDKEGQLYGPIDGPTERQKAEERKQKRHNYQEELALHRKMFQQRTTEYYQQCVNKVERVEAPFRYKRLIN